MNSVGYAKSLMNLLFQMRLKGPFQVQYFSRYKGLKIGPDLWDTLY